MIDAGTFPINNWLEKLSEPITNDNTIKIVYGSVIPLRDNIFEKCLATITIGKFYKNCVLNPTVSSLLIDKNCSKTVNGFPENKDGKSVYHQIVIKHEKRDEIRKELTDNEIGSAIYYETPIHKQPIYQNYRLELPNSEKFSKLILSLPSYPQLTNDQALEISECVNKVIG